MGMQEVWEENTFSRLLKAKRRENMNNCERCCFFEACTRLGRIENKDCIYGNKAEKDKGERHEEKDSSTMQ